MKKTTLLIIVCTFLLPIIALAQEETPQPQQNQFIAEDPSTYDYSSPDFYNQVDYNNWDWNQISSNPQNVQTAITALQDQGILQGGASYDESKALGFYSDPGFATFLENLPESEFEKLDGAMLVDSGNANKLNQDQIAANIDEITDLKALEGKELNSYIQDEFATTLDVSQCQDKKCTLVDGVLKNDGKNSNQIILSELTGKNAIVNTQNDGTILINFNQFIEEDDKLMFFSENNRFNFIINTRTQGVNLNLKEKDIGLLQGNFLFEKGQLFVIPEINQKDKKDTVKYSQFAGIGAVIFTKTNIEVSNKPLTTSDGFSNKVYISKDQNSIQMSGSGYSFMSDEFMEHVPQLNTRNGHRLIFTPQANKKTNTPSIVSYNKKTRDLEVEGNAKIQNGNRHIKFQQGHILSELRSISGQNIITLSDQTFNQLPLNMKLKGKPGEVIMTGPDKGNKIITKNSAMYSLQYNVDVKGNRELAMETFTDIKHGVKSPDIMVIGTRTYGGNCKGIPTAGCRAEKDEIALWQRYEQIWLQNSKDRPTFIINFDKDVYSSSDRGNNHDFMDKLIEAKNKNPFENMGSTNYFENSKIYFSGHSSDMDDKILFKISQGKAARRNYYIDKNQLGGGVNLKNPFFAGCSSGPLVGKPALRIDDGEIDIFSAFLVSKAKKGTNTWDEFVKNQFSKDKITFPSRKTCLNSYSKLKLVDESYESLGTIKKLQATCT
jgi:hypothetical protein